MEIGDKKKSDENSPYSAKNKGISCVIDNWDINEVIENT
jgi:hypothetical protein